MSRATPQIRALARSLITYEAGGDMFRNTDLLVPFSACEKLRLNLLTLMGNSGFRSLMSRSLVTAGAEVPWLRAVHVSKDGSLEGLADLQPQVAHDQFNEGSVELLAQMLGLLVVFVGEDLTLRQLQQVWPKLPLHHLNLKSGDKDEEES